MRKSIRDQIRRRSLYGAEGGVRIAAWRERKRSTDELIRSRKRGYLDKQKEHILAEDAVRNFYKHVRNFSKLEKPKQFDVRELVPVKSNIDVAKTLAGYFNGISLEFDALGPGYIPATHSNCLPVLKMFQVASRIRCFRKPKSMVPGDVFPKLVTKFSDFFAIPLTMVVNKISRTRCWPVVWKKEFVTVIPKKSSPQSLGDSPGHLPCI